VTARLIDTPADGVKPVASYSPAVRIGDLVAVAGQAGIDPEANARVDGGVRAELRQARANIEVALTSCGCTMDDVIRVDVFLQDLEDFEVLNEEYRGWFSEPYPSRTTIGANLLSGLAVEVTVLAVRPGSGS